ncbi:hypothetical protein FACS18947_6190 [Bacteroidia bacterium]|nr:hypothetical protein FACS18947_6190 [Bacteroidia bacterium]
MIGYLQGRKEQMDMLHRDNKFIIIICLIFFFASCDKYTRYDIKETKKIRTNCINKSQVLLGEEYWLVYNSAVDSINSWIDNEIGNFSYWRSLINYQLDSVLCVNKERDKIIMSILLPYIGEKGIQDDIEYFYGVKVQGQWYFFGGPTLVLPREFYQEDIHTPLSFEKLKQIATAEIYRGYLKKGRNGQWEINENFFQDLTSVAWCTDCTTQEDWDRKYLLIISENWSKRDTINNN